MPKHCGMQSKHRKLLEQRAANGDPHAAFAIRVLTRREAGITRQATANEMTPCIHGVWLPSTRCITCKESN